MGLSAEQRAFATNKLVATVEMLEKEGISAAQALGGIPIPLAALHDTATRMSVRHLLTGYKNAATLSRDPDFALKLGNNVQITSYGIYGFAMLSCPTHHATIDFALRYHELTQENPPGQSGLSMKRSAIRACAGLSSNSMQPRSLHWRGISLHRITIRSG